MKGFWLWLCLLLAGCSGNNNAPVENFSVQMPRPFGYVIGDEIIRKIEFDARNGVSLQAADLPGKGRLNRWLELNDVKVMRHDQHYRIELRYQLFYAALEVKALTLPGFNLRLQKDGQPFDQTVPDWEFTMSPLRESSVRKTEHGEYMRPDLPPPLLDTRLAENITYALLAFVLVIAGYLGYLYGLLPWLNRPAHFKRALRQLAGLPDDAVPQALHIMHRALNGLNRQPLFGTQLAGFLQRFPEYESVQQDLSWFFHYSNQYFFSADFTAGKVDKNRIQALCRACRAIERGSR